MARELPRHAILRFTTRELPPEHLVPLIEATREAFGLAKRGATALGYRRLCLARDKAAAQMGTGAAWEPELLRCWDQAVDWYVRFATPPPYFPRDAC